MRLATIVIATALAAGCGAPPPRWVAHPADVRVEAGIVYERLATRELKLDLYRGDDATGPQPAIVWIFGGGWLYGGRGECPIAPLARRGFVVASIDYRLADEARWPAQIEDCKAAVRYLRANAERLGIDPERIGAFGVSAGAHLAAMLGVSAGVAGLDGGGDTAVSPRVAGVIACFPATDLAGLCDIDGSGDWRMRLAVRRLLGADPRARPDLAAQASPLTWVSPDDAPFLIIHGTRDGFIPPWQSRVLHAALRGAGVPSRLVLVEGSGHGAWLLADGDVRARIDEFLAQRLSRGPLPAATTR